MNHIVARAITNAPAFVVIRENFGNGEFIMGRRHTKNPKDYQSDR
jgi:ATP sulfurylase